jgi:hypothetical protein
MRVPTTQGLNAESAVAVVATKDAQENRKQARARRRNAQQDRIDHMKEAASKLRDMADNSLYQGILKATPALCDIASKAVDKLAMAADAAGAGGTIDTGMAKAAIGAVAQAANVVNTIDPFGIINKYKEAEKGSLDAAAEVAQQRVQSASEDASEAQRLQGSMTSLMEKMQESRQAARMAAIKG